MTSSDLPNPSSTRTQSRQRNHAVLAGGMRRFAVVSREGELRLRIVGMNQECRAAIYVRLQQPHALVGRLPALHHDVVQLIAKKFVHHALVLAVDFKEIGEHSHRRKAAAE